MDSIESYLRKLIVASVGAADLGCEKLGKLLDECVARGEVTVEKGRVLNEELKRTCKQAVTKDEAEKPAVDVDAMSADEREALLQKLHLRQRRSAIFSWTLGRRLSNSDKFCPCVRTFCPKNTVPRSRRCART